MTELDCTSGADPAGSPVSTKTSARAGVLNREAGTSAVSIELLTNVVVKTLLAPFTDQTTRLRL